jgi:FkbM family methyltransferase
MLMRGYDPNGYISVGQKYIKIIEAFDDSLNVFCEVGSHFYYNCRLVRQMKQGKNVIIVEPLPQCVEDIQSHTKDLPNVTIHQAAVADFNGEETMYTDDMLASFADSVKRDDIDSIRTFNNPIKVKAIKFSEVDPGDIDVLLADCEGSEKYMLNHLLSKPKLIMVESAPTGFTKEKKEELDQWFEDNGYVYLEHYDNDDVFLSKGFAEEVEEALGHVFLTNPEDYVADSSEYPQTSFSQNDY